MNFLFCCCFFSSRYFFFIKKKYLIIIIIFGNNIRIINSKTRDNCNTNYVERIEHASMHNLLPHAYHNSYSIRLITQLKRKKPGRKKVVIYYINAAAHTIDPTNNGIYNATNYSRRDCCEASGGNTLTLRLHPLSSRPPGLHTVSFTTSIQTNNPTQIV